MRRIITVAVATAALSLASVSPAFADGKNPPTSCGVGSAVSSSTQTVGGLGKAARSANLNVGELIQQLSAFLRQGCQG